MCFQNRCAVAIVWEQSLIPNSNLCPTTLIAVAWKDLFQKEQNRQTEQIYSGTTILIRCVFFAYETQALEKEKKKQTAADKSFLIYTLITHSSESQELQ